VPRVPTFVVDRSWARGAAPLLAVVLGGCRGVPPPDTIRVSGYVEATEVQVAAEVGGRLVELAVDEGDRVAAGQVVARLDTRDAELALARLRAEREQAVAQRRLLEAGARIEDISQARAQVHSAEEDLRAAQAEVAAAAADLERFESLLRTNAGSVKQRDDAATRREVAEARVRAATARVAAARAALARLEAGARREELDAARARVAAVDAQIAVLEKSVADATVVSPVAGVVTLRLVDRGELVAPRAPLLVVTDLDRAWANVYVDEPLVPRVRLGQPATILTDAGQRLEGTVTFVSPRAEFTPRNVQTADERAKLVYRLRVSVDNRAGILKAGMPVEAELRLEKP
jgi:HlyD family secretion protein